MKIEINFIGIDPKDVEVSQSVGQSDRWTVMRARATRHERPTNDDYSLWAEFTSRQTAEEIAREQMMSGSRGSHWRVVNPRGVVMWHGNHYDWSNTNRGEAR